MTTDTTPFEILTAGTTLYHAVEPRIGDLVVVHKQGKFRRARVAKLAPKRVTVAWATSGTPRREQAVARAEVYETNDGQLSGGEPAGVIADNNADQGDGFNQGFGQGGRTGQRLKKLEEL